MVARAITTLLINALAVSGLAARETTAIDIRACGAVSGGETLCTAAIQQAVDRCAAQGGGTVRVPAGVWLTGTIILKSHIVLQLDVGSTLLGSKSPKDYPPHVPKERSYTDNYVRQSLIAGEDLDDVTICGRGTIDGNGGAFRWKEYRDRPYLIRLVGCRNVTVADVQLRNAAMWMQHYLACDYVRIQNIRVWNHVSYNNDGLDIDGCRHVVISGCVIDSDDDALCFKSTLDRACEDVVVSDCVLSSHCNALKMGTESNGGFRNIAISNCTIASPRYSKSAYGAQAGLAGIALETVDGGCLEGVTISNIAMQGVRVPIFVRLGNRARPFKKGMEPPPVGVLRNVTITNVVARGAANIGCSLTGLAGHPIKNVTLNNITIEFSGGGTKTDAGRQVAELPQHYPESSMFGTLPAYGFYCRHAQGLRLSGLRVYTAQREDRPAIVLDDVGESVVVDSEFTGTAGADAILHLVDGHDVTIRNNQVRAAVDTFLQVAGQCANVGAMGNDTHSVRQFVRFKDGAPTDCLIQFGNWLPMSQGTK